MNWITRVLIHNAQNPIEYWLHRTLRVWRFTFKLQGRRASNAWGRFGGGWHWELGFQTNRRLTCWIFTLLILSLRVSYERPKKDKS